MLAISGIEKGTGSMKERSKYPQRNQNEDQTHLNDMKTEASREATEGRV